LSAKLCSSVDVVAGALGLAGGPPTLPVVPPPLLELLEQAGNAAVTAIASAPTPRPPSTIVRVKPFESFIQCLLTRNAFARGIAHPAPQRAGGC
jgi:hypothetical protein